MSKVQDMASGKLYIAGEYAVVDGAAAIVVAVNRYVSVTIDDDDLRITDIHGKNYSSKFLSESNSELKDFNKLDSPTVYGSISSGCESVDSACVSLDSQRLQKKVNENSKYKTLYWKRSFNGKDILVEEEKYAQFYSYVLSAMNVVDKFAFEQYKKPLNKCYNVRISSDLDDSRLGRKYGLGSSAAVTVAVVRALCKWYDLDISTPDICKLALIASALVEGSGSGGDVAASVYGGWIMYRAYYRDWLKAEIEMVNSGDLDFHKLVRKKWPRLEVKRLNVSSSLRLLVGWTGIPSSSSSLVSSVKSNRLSQKLFTYEDFCLLSEACVQRLVKVLESGDLISLSHGLECNRQLLRDLSDLTQTPIETPKLTSLIETAKFVGAAAKTSGAGGGDCGIALASSYNKDGISYIKDTWKSDGIKPLNLNVAKINGTGKSSENIVLHYEFSEKLSQYNTVNKKKIPYIHEEIDFDDIRLPHEGDPITADSFAKRNASKMDSRNSSNLESSNLCNKKSSLSNSLSNKKSSRITIKNVISNLESQITSNRKNMHLAIADEQYKANSEAGFDDISFMPTSLPNISLENVDSSVSFWGYSSPIPLYINAITGGSKEAKAVNAQLARVSCKTNIPMSSGSLSAALKDPSLIDTFSVIRDENPEGFVFANVGAGTSASDAMRAIEMINANALQVHLNVAQELVMPEGDRDFSDWMLNIKNIAIACNKADIPMIVKETGCGMTSLDVRRLYDLGVRFVDIGGRGGTNFITIENSRRDSNDYGYLSSWGLTTVESLLDVMSYENCKNGSIKVFASGGVRTPLDVIRALALGAQAVGVAGEFLHILMHSGEEVLEQRIFEWIEQIRSIMALLGAQKVLDIRSKSRLILKGDSLEFNKSLNSCLDK